METVICLGDSLTFGYGVGRSKNWVSLAQSALGGQWLNAGLCGDTTGGMLARLEGLLARRAECILIMGGTNDILLTGSFEQAKLNMMAMAHHCLHANLTPVVCVPIPVSVGDGNPWKTLLSPRAFDEQRRYFDWLRNFADVFHVRCLDFCLDWDGACARNAAETLYQPDGIHPTAAGHRLMAQTVIDGGLARQ